MELKGGDNFVANAVITIGCYSYVNQIYLFTGYLYIGIYDCFILSSNTVLFYQLVTEYPLYQNGIKEFYFILFIILLTN